MLENLLTGDAELQNEALRLKRSLDTGRFSASVSCFKTLRIKPKV